MTDHDPRLARVLGPAEPELTCDQCFEMLDVYVEQDLSGGDPEATVPGMRAHLAGCPSCHEYFESLRALVASEDQT
jgi:hypothetical protein